MIEMTYHELVDQLLDWRAGTIDPRGRPEFGEAFPEVWQLDEVEREVVIRRFVDGETLEVVARELQATGTYPGSTRELVRKVERSALNRMAELRD